MSQLDDVYAKIRAADAAGDSASVQELSRVAGYLQNQAKPHNPAADMPAIDPAKDFGGLPFRPFGYDTGLTLPTGLSQRYAGVGEGMTNLVRGVGQRLGMVSNDDISQSRQQDAPLNATLNGKAGNFLGTAAVSAPLAMIPGANTLAGAGLIGLGSGFLAPHATDKEGLQNTAVGGLAGLVPLAAWRSGQLTAGAVGSVTDAMTAAGRNRIAAQTIEHFAGGPQEAQQAAQNMATAQPAVPGVQNTAGQVSGNAGIARLEQTMRQNPEVTQKFYQRDQGNQNALLDSIRNIAGDQGKRDFFAADRAAAADANYGAARANYDPANVTPDVQAQIDSLLKRPSINDASKVAQRLAQERGQSPDPEGSLGALHDTKTALDDQISTLKAAGKDKEAAAVLQSQNKLLQVMETLSPDYKTARMTFADMSKPINQMDLGQAFYNKLAPAMTDYGNNTRLTANTFATALRNGDATAAKATGFSGATMENVFTPEQNKTVQGVATELARRANAQEMGAISGPQTAQRLVSQNALRNILGPLGLPQSASENILLKTLMRPVQFAGQLAEPDILHKISEGLLDPKQMSTTILALQKQGYTSKQISDALEPYLAPAGRAALSLGNAAKQ